MNYKFENCNINKPIGNFTTVHLQIFFQVKHFEFLYYPTFTVFEQIQDIIHPVWRCALLVAFMLDQKMSSGRCCLKSWINLLWDFFSPPSLILFVFDSETRKGWRKYFLVKSPVFSFSFELTMYMICKFDAWTDLDLLNR